MGTRQAPPSSRRPGVGPLAILLVLAAVVPLVAGGDRAAGPGTALLTVVVRTSPDDADPAGAKLELIPPRGPRLEGVADGEGRARFQLAPVEDLVVVARLPGRMRDHETVSLDAGDQRKVTLYLRPIAIVAGTVRSSSDGSAIAGATVRSYHDVFFRHPWCGTSVETRFVPPLGLATTDAKGRFEVEVEEGRGLITVAAEAPWHRPGHVSRFDSDDDWGEPWDLDLEPASALRGTVLDPDGEPVAGARVLAVARNDFDLDPDRPLAGLSLDRAELEEGWYTGFEEAWKTLRTRADDAGRFTLHGLVPGAVYHAWALGEGLAASACAADVRAPDAGESVARDFRLRRPAVLEVRAVWPEGAAPGPVTCVLDTDGRRLVEKGEGPNPVVFESLVPGSTVLTVVTPGYRPIRQELTLEPGERRILEPTLDPGVSFHGVVVDDRGEPVAGADLEVAWARVSREFGEDEPGSAGEAVTAEDGTFRIGGLLAGLHRVSVTSDEVARLHAPVEVTGEEVRFVAPRRGGFRIRFEFPEGRSGEFGLEHFTDEPGGGMGTTTNYDADDPPVYESTGHPAGEIRFDARVEGFAPFGRTIEIEPGRTVDLGTVALDPGVALEGVVIDQDGNPFEGLRIRAQGPDWGRNLFLDISTFTDAVGRFRLEHLPRTEATIEVTWDFRPLFSTTLTLGDDPEPVQWTVTKPALLVALVTNEAGLPITGVALRAYGQNGVEDVRWDAEKTSRDDGRIFMVLAPGLYRLELVRDGKPVPAGELTIAAGERRERTFVVPAR